MPRSARTSKQAAMASRMFSKASSWVDPWLTHPGMDEHSATQTPSSSRSSVVKNFIIKLHQLPTMRQACYIDAGPFGAESADMTCLQSPCPARSSCSLGWHFSCNGNGACRFQMVMPAPGLVSFASGSLLSSGVCAELLPRGRTGVRLVARASRRGFITHVISDPSAARRARPRC